MERMKELIAGHRKAAALLGLALALGLTLVPITVLAYANPSGSALWARGPAASERNGLAVLDEDSESEVTPTSTSTSDPDQDVDDPDEDETPEPTSAAPITATPTLTVTPSVTAVVTLRGPVSQVVTSTAGSVIGVWTIAGRAVTVTAETHLSARARRVQPGVDWAKAVALRLADGSLVARSIEVMHANRLVRVVGTIDQFSSSQWVVGGTTVSVTTTTRIVGTPAVGRLADVHGTMVGDAFVARLIIVRGTGKLPKGGLGPPGKEKKLTATPVPPADGGPTATPTPAAGAAGGGGQPGKDKTNRGNSPHGKGR